MGFLSYKAPMPDQLNGMKSTILYARPFRTQIAILIGLINLLNFGILVVCCVAAANTENPYVREGYYGRRHRVDEGSFSRAALFFFFVPIPLVVWINSCVELYKRWRRTLQPMRVVVGCCATLVLLGMAGGIWSPCIYPPWWVGFRGRESKLDYCPFVSNVGWDWIGADVKPPSTYAVLPWLLLPIAVLYFIYLGFAGAALHHLRRERRLNGPASIQHEMYNNPDEAYQYYPSVYTEPNPVPKPLASTYRKAVPSPTSPTQSTRPPSYAKSTAAVSNSYVPSRSLSNYSSDAKDSRSSHGPCTCTCPHHH